MTHLACQIRKTGVRDGFIYGEGWGGRRIRGSGTVGRAVAVDRAGRSTATGDGHTRLILRGKPHSVVFSSRRTLLRRLGVGSLAAAAGCVTGDTRTVIPSEQTTRRPIADVDGSWRSYQADTGNSGATSDPGPVAEPTERWTYRTLVGGPAVGPAAADGRVFVVTDSGVLFARDAATGELDWRADRSVASDVRPVAGRGVVVAADGSRLVAFDASNGRVRWRLPYDGRLAGLTIVGSRVIAAGQSVWARSLPDGTEAWTRSTESTPVTRPAGSGETVAVGLSDGTVLALDADDGTERWRSQPGELRGSPAVAGDAVVAATETALVAFDASDGSRRWRESGRRTVVGGPTIGDGRVHAVRVTPDVEQPDDQTGTPPPTDTRWYEARLVARDATDGSAAWRVTRTRQYNFTSGPPERLPVVTAGARVFVGFDGAVTAFGPAGSQLWTARTDRVAPVVTAGIVSTGGTGVDPADGTVRWRFSPGSTVESAPAVVGRTAYVGSDDGYCYALDARDGSVRWRVRTDGFVRTTPAVTDDSVYVGTNRDTLYALDRADGSTRWTRTLTGPIQPPTMVNDTVYVGDFSRTVYALDTADGTVVWRASGDADRFVALEVAVGAGLVFAGANGILRAFDAADGSEAWRRAFADDYRVQSPAVFADDTVFVSAGRSTVALDPADGTERWSRETGGSNRPPVMADGTVYAPGGEFVWAFDAADGTRRWRTRTGEDLRLAVGDAVYGVGFDTPLLALDPDDGSRRWRLSGAQPTTAPTVADRYLFAGDETGRVFALGPAPE